MYSYACSTIPVLISDSSALLLPCIWSSQNGYVHRELSHIQNTIRPLQHHLGTTATEGHELVLYLLQEDFFPLNNMTFASAVTTLVCDKKASFKGILPYSKVKLDSTDITFISIFIQFT